MKEFYQELRQQIEDTTTVQHVRLWNNQIDLFEKGEQIPFLFPAVFIDFPSIPWLQIGGGEATSELMTRLYIVFESFATAENEEDLAIFDLRQEVYLAVQDFKPTQSSKLQRINEQTDPNHTNVYVWVMDFISNYTDPTAAFPRGGITAEINTIVLNGTLKIDPNTVDGIRTDKDFE